ncbi:MAG: Mut7-C RNAse domain-containing protein [Thermodesulfobacteriota bacterium]|nr:Mut7-C RNAse domain-containing protein [Thermodesulfobacteriota bacterium]
MNTVYITFHGNLQELLTKRHDENKVINHSFDRRASIKDVIESLGIPHVEIERLLVNGKDVTFDYIATDTDQIDVFGLTPPFDVFSVSVLRPEPLREIRFVVDVNVGKLATLLRMSGFDTFYKNGMTDPELAEICEQEKRILLTKDCNLLKRKNVIFGHLVREVDPKKQLAETINLFSLIDKVLPFSRCLVCNRNLVPVAKKRIIHRLKPLTKKYYDSFYICMDCDKLYWPGSHREKMEKVLKSVLQAIIF